MEKTKEINWDSLDNIDQALNKAEDAQKALRFLADSLLEYPHAGGHEETATIIKHLANDVQEAADNIRTIIPKEA